ncbi:4a-hydroxytetrahydrobiopterin dehydratase [Neorhodopirellula lusitana]|uniref:4a-hydroxytetrahydrobiopterin dehydratase n=1 Tax=Neorhodopirellula lusitana TaxID=445327 RepID=UPI0038513F1B
MSSPPSPSPSSPEPGSQSAACDFSSKRCVPCEGGVPVIDAKQAASYLVHMPNWHLSDDGKSISWKKNTKNFVGAVERINRIAEVAEAEQHHPDLHITGYRHLTVVLTTHAIDGLSENDFIVAAKIDELFQ